MQKIKPSMDMDDEIDLHRKGWIIQRVGWVALFMILAAAALGLFGNGVLSKKQIEKRNILLSYEQFGRFESRMEIRINAGSTNEKLEIKIPQAYLQKMELDKIVPNPLEQKIANNKMIFTFHTNDLAQITILLLPKTTGTISTTVYVDGNAMNVSHFIYP